jgi:phosphocarrier protein HPr
MGLHVRAASAIASLAARYNASVLLAKNGEPVSATDVLQILTLGAAAGDPVRLEASGPQAEEAVEALAELLGKSFDDDEPATP